MSWKTCKLLFTLTSIARLSHCVQLLQECYHCGGRKWNYREEERGTWSARIGHWATWMAPAFNHECFTEVTHKGQLFVFQKRWRFWKHKQLEAQPPPTFDAQFHWISLNPNQVHCTSWFSFYVCKVGQEWSPLLKFFLFCHDRSREFGNQWIPCPAICISCNILWKK